MKDKEKRIRIENITKNAQGLRRSKNWFLKDHFDATCPGCRRQNRIVIRYDIKVTDRDQEL